MSTVENILAQFPAQPDNAEYQRLVAALQRLDEATREPGFSMAANIASYIDHDAIVHVAAARIASEIGEGDDFYPSLTSWMEGFIVGLEYERSKP